MSWTICGLSCSRGIVDTRSREKEEGSRSEAGELEGTPSTPLFPS